MEPLGHPLGLSGASWELLAGFSGMLGGVLVSLWSVGSLIFIRILRHSICDVILLSFWIRVHTILPTLRLSVKAFLYYKNNSSEPSADFSAQKLQDAIVVPTCLQNETKSCLGGVLGRLGGVLGRLGTS